METKSGSSYNRDDSRYVDIRPLLVISTTLDGKYCACNCSNLETFCYEGKKFAICGIFTGRLAFDEDRQAYIRSTECIESQNF